MLVYTLLLILSLLTLVNNKYMKSFYYILWIYMLLIAGFRKDVGTDFERYENAYMSGVIWFDDIGMKYLIDIFHFFNLHPMYFFFGLALIIQILIIKALKKYCSNSQIFLVSLFLYITLYYFNTSLNQIRQFIAIGIFLLNIDNIINKKFFKYNLLFIVSFIFHSSVIIFYPLYFIGGYSAKLLNSVKALTLGLLLSFSLMFIRFDYIVSEILLNFEKFTFYAIYGFEKFLKYELSFEMFLILLLKLFLSIWIIHNKKYIISTYKEEVIFRIFYIGLFLTFPLYPMLIFRRLLYYVNIVEIIIYALFMTKNKRAMIVFVIFAIIYYFANLLSGFSNPLPYKLYLFET